MILGDDSVKLFRHEIMYEAKFKEIYNTVHIDDFYWACFTMWEEGIKFILNRECNDCKYYTNENKCSKREFIKVEYNFNCKYWEINENN